MALDLCIGMGVGAILAAIVTTMINVFKCDSANGWRTAISVSYSVRGLDMHQKLHGEWFLTRVIIALLRSGGITVGVWLASYQYSYGATAAFWTFYGGMMMFAIDEGMYWVWRIKGEENKAGSGSHRNEPQLPKDGGTVGPQWGRNDV